MNYSLCSPMSRMRSPLHVHLRDCSECSARLDRLRAEVSAIRVMREVPFASSPVSVQRSLSKNCSPLASTEPLENESAGMSAPVARVSSSRNSELDDRRFEADGEVPTAIGKYLIVGRFPESGQAEVFRVVHRELHRDLVLKIAHRPIGEDGLSEVVADGQRLAELDHPNIVRVYDLDFYEGRPYLVMEYIRGRTLTQYAREEQVPPRLAATHVAELAGAVALRTDGESSTRTSSRRM